MIDFLLNTFSSFHTFAYFFVFLFSFLENYIFIGWLVPGSFLLAIFSFLSSKGFFSWQLILFFAFLGNYIASIISYYIGRKVAKSSINKGYKFFKSNFFQKSKKYYQNNHILSLILGKLIPGVKETIPFIAGVFHLSKVKFFIYSFIGSFLWAFSIIVIVFLFSISFDIVVLWLERVGFIVFFVFIGAILMSIFRYYIFMFGKTFFSLLKSFLLYIFSKFGLKKFKISSYSKYIFLLIFIGAIVYLILAYIGFLSYIYKSYFWLYIDEAVENLFFYLRYSILIYFFLFISFFGKFWVIFILSLIFSIYLINKKETKFLFPYWLLFTILSLVVVLTKYIVGRERPLLSVYLENGYSFPSFHASLSLFFYGVLFYYIFKKEKGWKNKTNIIMIAIIVILLIGFSRIYLGVHFLSDVVGGYILGFLAFVLFLFTYKYIPYKINFNKKISSIFIYLLFGILILYFPYYIQNLELGQVRQVGQHIDNLDNVKNIFLEKPYLSYTTTISGRRTEPINFIYLAKKDSDITNIFKKAGFKKADKLSLRSIGKLGLAVYDNINYSSAPFLPLFWNKNVQDLGFQKQEKNIKKRHHIRIWKTNYSIDGYRVYVGSAVYDDDIKWKITHKIDPNLDKEREYFFNNLEKTGLIKDYTKIKISDKKKGKNFSYDIFYTDGMAYIIKITD